MKRTALPQALGTTDSPNFADVNASATIRGSTVVTNSTLGFWGTFVANLKSPNLISGNWQWLLPDKSGTIAMTSDVAAGNLFVGKYASLSALQTAHPTGIDGNYAFVYGSVSDQQYIWDGDHTAWVLTSVIPAGTFAALGGSPADNAALAASLSGKVNTATTVNGKSLSTNITLNADDIAEKATTPANLYFTSARVLALMLTNFKSNFWNALGTVVSYFTNSNTAVRTYTFQDRNGTIADDTDLATKVDLTGNQTIAGNKTFTGLTTVSANTPILQLQTSADNSVASVSRTATGNTMSFRNAVFQQGGRGNSVTYNGINQYRTFPDTGLPNGTGIIMTASGWFYFNSLSQGQTLFQFGGGASYTYMGIYNDYITFSRSGSVIYASNTIVNLSVNTWYHLAFVFDGSNTSTLYVNGTSYPITGGSMGVYTPNGYVSNSVAGTSPQYPNYREDQIAIWATALTATQILSIYNGGGGTSTLPGNPIVRYEIEDASGSVYLNTGSLGTNNNASLINLPTWLGSGYGIIPISGSATTSNWMRSVDGVNSNERGQAYFGEFLSGTYLQGLTVKHSINGKLPFIQSNNGNTLISISNIAENASSQSALGVVDGVAIGSYATVNTAPAHGLIVSGPTGFGTASPSSSYVYDANGATVTRGISNILSATPEQRLVTSSDSAYARFQRSSASGNNMFSGKNQVLQVGGIGKCLTFNGTNQYFTGSDAGLPTGSAINITVAVWVKTMQSIHVPIFVYGGLTTGLHFYLDPSSGALGCQNGPTTLFRRTGLPPFDNGNWHHVVVTINSSGTVNVYIDGISYSSTFSTPYNISLNGTFVNNVIGTGLGYGAMTLDQLLIYNTVLSSANITALYNSGAGTASPVTAGLIRRYEFEDGTGNNIADSNPNTSQYALTTVNSPTWNNNGIAPISSSNQESTWISVSDGLVNAERGVVVIGEYNGRLQKQGKWFQWFQNNLYPLASNNNGQWRFDPNNTSSGVPAVASTIDVAGNITIGSAYAGISVAPANGAVIQGRMLIGTSTDNSIDQLQIAGNIALMASGNKLNIATGTNASIGTAILASGTVTVNTTSVTTNSIVMLTYNTPNGTLGILGTGAKTPGSSFVINSLTANNIINTLDTSEINWWIIN